MALLNQNFNEKRLNLVELLCDVAYFVIGRTTDESALIKQLLNILFIRSFILSFCRFPHFSLGSTFYTELR
jgi:hypothetical protein